MDGFHRASRPTKFLTLTLAFSLFLGLLTACGKTARNEKDKNLTITLGAYTTPREAYDESILPAFQRHFRHETGQQVEFRQSYLGSGAQARAIESGFEADVAALSLSPDLEKLRAAGLIRHDDRARPHGGVVTRSVVVIGVRENNPKGIVDWEDLARPGIDVLTPNVRTSGGAMWNVLAIYGAALRGHAGVAKDDEEAAVRLLAAILRNVKVMDRGARDSLLTFERGVGDAIITYENEMLVGRSQGQKYEIVVPLSTILIENPVALVDVYVERHGNREVTEAFLEFLVTPEAQRAYARHGLRPVLPSVEKETKGFARVDDLFDVRDLGDWKRVDEKVFADGGVYDRALALSRSEKTAPTRSALAASSSKKPPGSTAPRSSLPRSEQEGAR